VEGDERVEQVLGAVKWSAVAGIDDLDVTGDATLGERLG